MRTDNLNKTNMEGLTSDFVENIESMLGKEIEVVNNFKLGFDYGFCIMPDDIIFANNWPCKRFSPFYHNAKYTFDFNKGVLTVTGRNKYERKYTTNVYQMEIVGYKLKTTHKNAGYIWGNPKLVES